MSVVKHWSKVAGNIMDGVMVFIKDPDGCIETLQARARDHLMQIAKDTPPAP